MNKVLKVVNITMNILRIKWRGKTLKVNYKLIKGMEKYWLIFVVKLLHAKMGHV